MYGGILGSPQHETLVSYKEKVETFYMSQEEKSVLMIDRRL